MRLPLTFASAFLLLIMAGHARAAATVDKVVITGLDDELMQLNVDPETIEFPKLVRAISDMNRSSVALKKYRDEMREKVAAAARAVGDVAKRRGMSAEAVDEIRREILGIAT